MSELPAVFDRLRLPVIAAPLFIISTPDLVIAQCKAGVVGSFPALNAREQDGDPIMLDIWLSQITIELDRHNQANPDSPAAPFAVNQIVHRSNARLDRDLEICAKWNVPIWITSLGARVEVNDAAHSCGGIALHDVINNRFAKKAIEKGADGLIAVAVGAGGHAGQLSPLALIGEIREWFNGPLLLSGAISTGQSILAAQAMGADLAYIGTPFIATEEANAVEGYKRMITQSSADDIVYSSLFTGVHGNYLKPSIANAGMDPNNLPQSDSSAMDFSDKRNRPKSWKDIWGAGQGVGAIKGLVSTQKCVDQLYQEYNRALDTLWAKLNG